jgi:hypothetical protein
MYHCYSFGFSKQRLNFGRVTNSRHVLKNPLTAPGRTVEVDQHRATKAVTL